MNKVETLAIRCSLYQRSVSLALCEGNPPWIPLTNGHLCIGVAFFMMASYVDVNFQWIALIRITGF